VQDTVYHLKGLASLKYI